MDNASKALIMAGGILIAVLVISVSIYVITTARGVAKISNEKLEANAVQSFNRFYVAYGNGSGDEITPIDAINIYRKAVDDKERESAFKPIEVIDVPDAIKEVSNLIDNGTGNTDWASQIKKEGNYKLYYTKDADGYIYNIKITE